MDSIAIDIATVGGIVLLLAALIFYKCVHGDSDD